MFWLHFQTIAVQAYDTESMEIVSDLSGVIPDTDSQGSIRSIYGLAYRKKDGSHSARLLVTSADQSITLVQLPGMYTSIKPLHIVVITIIIILFISYKLS